MISRNHILGVGLAVGVLLAGGTSFAAADTPSPAAPSQCVVTVGPSGAQVPIPVTKDPKRPVTVVPCSKLARGGTGAVPKGAPQTGGGGMAVEVGSRG